MERSLLTPFAGLQQQVADQLTGAPSDLVYADASCSGGDPMALCAGTILAFPAAWGARLRGAALGLLAITLLNVVRLGHLLLVASDRALRCLFAVGLGIVAGAEAVPVWGALFGGTAAGLQALAGHAGHVFVDARCLDTRAGFQLGLFTSLWAALAGHGISHR